MFRIKLEITAVLKYANSMRLHKSADLKHARLSQESHFYNLSICDATECIESFHF